MRIGYLVNQYPRTSHSFIRREIQALEAQGAEVLRYSLRGLQGELPTPADRDELGRTRVVLARGMTGLMEGVVRAAARAPLRLGRALGVAVRLGWRTERGLLRHLAYLAEACVLTDWVRAARVDHVHVHFGTNGAVVALLARELGGPPFSLTVHGPREFDSPEDLRLTEKIGRSAFTVAISSFGRSQLYRWARFEDWPRIHIVRCGLEPDLLATPPTPIPADARLVCVGRLCEQKGHLVLLDAVARLAHEGLKFELVLVGDGPLRGAIEARIRSAGLAERVRIAGWLGAPAVREEILRSRALVLASFAEGLPVVLMEALALGRPVVTTAIAGNPELVEHGVNGWLVPAGSAEALAGALRRVLQRPVEELERMGRAGAVRVAELHDARREAARLLALFESYGTAAQASGDPVTS